MKYVIRKQDGTLWGINGVPSSKESLEELLKAKGYTQSKGFTGSVVPDKWERIKDGEKTEIFIDLLTIRDVNSF